MLYIGIDLGTSAVKLLMMDGTGKICKIVSKEYPLYFPHPGWSEQNPCDWYEKTLEGLKELTADCNRAEVAGISFGGQMHGLVALDENDEVIPGLFNVGAMIGDMYANTYNFAVPGNSYGINCLTFGYLLGRDLASGKFDA